MLLVGKAGGTGEEECKVETMSSWVAKGLERWRELVEGWRKEL